ncbi:MAG: hypothetical protein K1X68_02755 [Saprospiraceae bacterium]|nr:hypothetical protein [Saprospiraceae bacterium]HMW39157.1 hypothetical protein [Saprospiraceae bacterium]HMX88742.1 hypothetical protein [Saprospiraceae bacterium]HMZ38874.1 hypothetical protein [Saprospiraceae bacterium]HNA64496.1 hypothetical protein [Saprospiraceae bacterium]
MKKITIILCFSGIMSSVVAQTTTEEEYIKKYQERIKLTRINDVYIPANTEEAMKELVRLTEEDARKKLLTVPEDTIASKLHFSLGRWMQLNWGMDEGSRISHYFKTKGVSYTDDQIDLLLRCFYRFVGGKDLREDDLVRHYVALRKSEADLRKRKAKVIKELGPGKKHNE